jgi:hypothetical protein
MCMTNEKKRNSIIIVPFNTTLIADLFLYCYEVDFMSSLSPTSHQDIIHAFNNISRYLDDILSMNNPYFD